MSQEGGESGGLLENHAEDVIDQENEQPNLNNVIDRDLAKENAFLENDNSGSIDDVKELRGEIESLKREILEERQTRGAAEEALKHLRAAHSEADMNAQELSAKLAEAQQKMDQEIKERDEKYSELDSKFNRLHKRAKQRIQEVQKEKDDLEAQLREVNEKADLTSSQLSALQQELERTRQHANEALKAMDVERQQLRSANNKLRDSIEELRHSLVPKENALEAMQQSLLEKEQMLEDMRELLQVADEKRQASIAELSLKHQKQVEDMKAQIADVLAERSRATETISSLREEQKSFRDLADKMMEEKDKEISRLLDDNKNLNQLLDSRPSAEYRDDITALQKQEAPSSSASAAEQQILVCTVFPVMDPNLLLFDTKPLPTIILQLILARQQAQREEELAQTQRHILALQEEIEELEHENRLHRQQEAKLKEELRNMERTQKREGVDLTYLKNVILKLLETGEVERLLPVIAMLLQFSPDECMSIRLDRDFMRTCPYCFHNVLNHGPDIRNLFVPHAGMQMQKCQQAYRSSNDVTPSPASDSSGSGLSLFSRFSFS
ncbi:UNVERIFIED_CONTAM: protein GRIP [Sesamum latifolium]|uniref:Protein GRIP n=1 Tax=Sesamum latifolium TaxID=2727402 RepID=A0AAW2YCW2_9LAMI